MAENKKSFVLYSDSQGLVNQLPDDVAGRLLKHIYAYVNDENPITDELLLNIAFEPIKMHLKRDLQRWETQIEQRRQAGLRSAEVRKRNATSVNERSISSTDNVNVNDNVNVITTIQSDVGVISFDDAVNICLFSEQWKEDIERMYKVDRDKVKFALNEFKTHCGTIGENKPKTLNQFKKHFTNWVRVKKQYQVKTENKDRL
jgi:hypothetical protein